MEYSAIFYFIIIRPNKSGRYFKNRHYQNPDKHRAEQSIEAYKMKVKVSEHTEYVKPFSLSKLHI